MNRIHLNAKGKNNMNKYRNLMVMGAGAVGGYFGGRIAERTSSNVTMIVRGAHLQAMQEQGLQIKSVDGDSEIQLDAFKNPAEALSPDLILFTVKSFDTPEAIMKITPVVGEETQVLTIQNGIENYAQLADTFGQERVIQGFCKIGAGIVEPGVIEHKAFGEITVGEMDGTESPRMHALKGLFEEAEIPLHITSEIVRKVWLKFAWNCVFNMITAVANVTVEKLFEHKETEALCYRVFNEIRAIAAAEGVQITDKDEQNIIEPARLLKGFTTSTYQDRQRGKKLEYEAFTGAIVRLAGKHDLEVPHNKTLYALLKLVDNN